MKDHKVALGKLKRYSLHATTNVLRHQAAMRYVDCLQKMILRDAPPQYEHYTTAIEELRTLGEPDVGRIVWQMMEREKVVPDYRLANAMLRLCVYAQRDDWALEVWNRYCAEAPWLEPNGQDPQPLPPPLPTLDTLSLGELQALPMWAKTHQAHPNLQLQTRNRWNVTRELHLNMCRCMCATVHFDTAETLFSHMEEKLLSTPTPKPMPPNLAEFDKYDQPWERLTTRHRRKLRAFEHMIADSKAIQKEAPVQNPWRPSKRSMQRVALPRVGRAKGISNVEFLHHAFITVLRDCRSNFAEAEKYAQRYCKLLQSNRRFASGLRQMLARRGATKGPAKGTAAPQPLVVAEQVQKALKKVLDSCHGWAAAVADLSSRQGTLTAAERRRLLRLRRKLAAKRQLDRVVLTYTVRHGSPEQLTALCQQQGRTDEAVRHRLLQKQEARRPERDDFTWMAKLQRRKGIPKLCKAWIWLQTVRIAAEASLKTMGFTDAVPPVSNDPYFISLPDVQTVMGTGQEGGDLTPLFGALLDVARCGSADGVAVCGLMRRLTGPVGHPYGAAGRAVPDSKMYQTCLLALLQQLGMPGKYWEQAQVRDATTELVADHLDQRMALLEPLRLQYAAADRRGEAERVAGLARQLWGEVLCRGLPTSLLMHNTFLQIMVITNPASFSVHRHFTAQIYRKFPWDSLTAMCLLLEYYSAPSPAKRHASVMQLVQWMRRYRVKPTGTLKAFMDRHEPLCGVPGHTRLEKAVLQQQAQYQTRLQESRGNEALVRF
eukprot:EG_transcript_3096